MWGRREVWGGGKFTSETGAARDAKFTWETSACEGKRSGVKETYVGTQDVGEEE